MPFCLPALRIQPSSLCGRPHNSQVITGDNALRRAEDIGGQELSYAEVKAIASGNPAVLTLAEADAELQRLTLLKKNHLDEQYVARRSVRDLPGTIANLSDRLSNLTADQTKAATHASDSLAIGGRTYRGEDIPAVLGNRLEALPKHAQETTRVPIGTYRGLSFGIVLHPQFQSEVYLEGAIPRQSTLSREHQGPRAVLNALERLTNAYGSECDRVRQDLAIAESQLRDYRERLGKPFVYESYLSELTSLRDQLKAGLSGATLEPGNQAGPSVSELAERIKALKATNNVEAVPQRIGQRQSSAEEPITARIRRRTESMSASDRVTKSDAAPEAEDASMQELTQNSSLDSPRTFRERLAAERQCKDDGPSPP